jgi:hypothetical protein
VRNHHHDETLSAAADTVVRQPASTSVKTSTRCKSCLLICTQPNLSPPTLISGWGSDTLALQSYDIIALLLQDDCT